MAPSRKPAVVPTNVPSVRELCDTLGFKHATSRETSVFTDTTHAFRKSYSTTSGESGVDLTEWNDGAVQQELSAMATKFLDEGGHGLRFWSDSRSWIEEGDFEYPKDKALIAGLLKQLFWKQNKYALNNQKYSDKKYCESRDRSRESINYVVDDTQSSSNSHTISQPNNKQSSIPSSTAPNTRARRPTITLLDERRPSVEQQTKYLTNDVFGSSVAEHDRRQILATENQSFQDSSAVAEKPRLPAEQSTNKKRATDSPSPKIPGKTGDCVLPTETPGSPSSKRQKVQQVPEERQKLKDQEDQTNHSQSLWKESTSYKIPDVDDYLGRELALDESEINRDGQLRPWLKGKEKQNTLQHSQTSFAKWMTEQQKKNATVQSDGESAVEETPTCQQNITLMPPLTGNTSSMYSYPSRETLVEVMPSHPPAGDIKIPTKTLLNLPGLQKIAEKAISAAPLFSTPSLPSPPIIYRSSEPTKKTKSRLHGSCWIVRSSEPYDAICWLNGTIRNRSLASVMGEISSKIQRVGISKLKIRLKTTLNYTTATIDKGAEDHWEYVMMDLEDRIRDAFARDANTGNHYRIWIEPIFENVGHPGLRIERDNEKINF